jgi:hypothetical protein
MTDALAALRAVDFDWVRSLDSVWRDPPFHVATLNAGAADDVMAYFLAATRDPAANRSGRIVVGPAGRGKTHLIGELRRRAWADDAWFVLLNFIGIRDFWSSVALGFLNSLQVKRGDGQTQYYRLVLKLASTLELHAQLSAIAKRYHGRPREIIGELVRAFVGALGKRFREETMQHADVIRALVLLISDELDCASVAHGWLQGMEIDKEAAHEFGFRTARKPAIEIVRGLSWILSLTGPTMIAIDQIDAIVSENNLRALIPTTTLDEEQQKAQSIIEALAGGLMDLHEQKVRAVTVISCLEATWEVLRARATSAVTDRYTAPLVLKPITSAEAARALIAARLADGYARSSFTPPHETWPFAPEAFESARNLTPRELLKLCDEHRTRCLADGTVSVCASFDGPAPVKPGNGRSNGLDAEFGLALALASADGLLGPDGEDHLRDLLDTILGLYAKHLDLPADIDVTVQRDPDQRRPSLHGRLSFTFRAEADREQHYCFRVIGHSNAIAFQTRLRSAITASGIDTALRFRHLFVLRRDPPPSGARTKTLLDQFAAAGGTFIAPTDDDLCAFLALRDMAQRMPPGFEAWLRQRRPLFDTTFFKVAGLCPPPFLDQPPPARPAPPTPAAVSPEDTRAAVPPEPAPQPAAAEAPAATPPAAPVEARTIPIGRRHERGVDGEAVSLAADLLPRHVAILAGAGSGKTVLLRRLVEEAALLGIPAIVLDPNNDLSRLGEAWPTAPNDFTTDDAAKAARYIGTTEVVIWTPGRSAGNPVSLALLPDFAAIGDDRDEIDQAVEMARATLEPFVAATGTSARLKTGVLSAALRRFAERGGGPLADLVRLLEDLPEGISQVSKAGKLAADMADQLHAATESNPLLRAGATSLDPAVLFESPRGHTRISVVNLAGLASDAARDAFVNQLQMTLFTWIKRRPSASGRLYVLDEAQNFVPSQAGTACKASALSLVAQARKYGLGMVLATQTPKGIDNRIVSNCTTHFYGRMASPATIEATRELMAAKGGAADDIGRLGRGEFWFSTEGLRRPVKIRTPLCLSHHPANPPTAEDILTMARTHAP